MPSQSSILARLAALELTVATMASTEYVDIRIGTVQDDMGTLLSELSIIQQKLENINIPEDTRYYLAQEEIDFIRNGMSTVTKFMVELENLRDELLRLAQQAL